MSRRNFTKGANRPAGRGELAAAAVKASGQPSPMAELVEKKNNGVSRAVQDATKRLRAELITALGELAAARRRIAELEETIEIMREDVDE